MKILGISAFYHDSAAALVADGEIIAAAQEERFTRVKHDERFPVEAIRYCLEEAKTDLSQIDLIVFYEKPLLKFERLLETYFAVAPKGFQTFRLMLPAWLKEKLFTKHTILKSLKSLPGSFAGKIAFTEHHESHAASAFFPSPFEKAAIVTVDGVGEWTTTSIAKGNGNQIELLSEQRFPHSLGLLYSAFTYYCGFRVNSGEYKLMGLAPYGEPKYVDTILEHLIDLKEDGSFRLDMAYFSYCHGLTMTGPKFHQLFGSPPRKPESSLETFHMDLAASIQKVIEKAILLLVEHTRKITGCDQLCLAGGVALNCVANGCILRESGFKNIWIQPAAGDAGGALGAALFTWYQLLEKPRKPIDTSDGQSGTRLGPAFSNEEIERLLVSKGVPFTKARDDHDLCEKVADLLANEQVAGWFQGRMEFGPRALGGRSILGDPRSENMQKVMNVKIKFRESFRPFAPSVLREHVHECFAMNPNEDSPYMLLVADIADGKKVGDPSSLNAAIGLDKLPVKRSDLQAITHVDYSARVQTVDAERNPLYHKLLGAFHQKTGCPVLINTSFNVRGEPIVCTPEDAFRCFLATNMDVLVLGHYLLKKEDMKDLKPIDVEAHLSQFALD